MSSDLENIFKFTNPWIDEEETKEEKREVKKVIFIALLSLPLNFPKMQKMKSPPYR